MTNIIPINEKSKISPDEAIEQLKHLIGRKFFAVSWDEKGQIFYHRVHVNLEDVVYACQLLTNDIFKGTLGG